MNDISEIFNVDPNSWIDSLNTYQKNIISQLYAQTNDYEVVANKWLTATIPTNVPFGTQKSPSIFYEKVLDEIEAFFTGDEKYKDSRLAILKESGVVQSYVVGGISIALAPVLGTSAPFLAPVIAIVLLTIGKIGLNAWLATRREKREKKAIRKNKQKELTDESKSVSSLFMNNEKMLPNRCHRGHQTLENPVIPGFSGPLKSFKLDRRHRLLRDLVYHPVDAGHLSSDPVCDPL